VIHITKDNYDAEVVSSDKPVLIDFGAPWCGPCKQVAKLVKELDAEQSAVKICEVDIDQSPEIAAKLGVISIPVLIFFKGGKPVERMAGLKSKAAVMAMIGK